MEAAELAQVSNSIRNAMGEGMGGFRKAALDSSSQINKVIKDIARTFAEQRKDMAGLENSIQDSVHESEQTNARIDRLASIFQESISLQTNMFGELKNIGANMRVLNDNTVQMSRNIGAGVGGLTVTSLLSSSLTTLQNLATSAAAGFGLGSLIGLVRTPETRGGGGGGMESNDFYRSIIEAEGTAKHGNPYETSLGYMKSPKPLTQMTMDESLAWGEQVKASQGMNSSAKGAFQIVNTTQREAMAALGMKGSDLFNEENQKKMASWIAHKQGLGAWEGFKSHPEQLRVAQQALQSGADKDFSSRPISQSSPMSQSFGGEHGGGHGIISGALEGGKGSIISTAESFLGKSESNAKDELQKFIGQFHHPIDIQKTPWCAAFVNSVLGSQGMPTTGSDAARSFLSYGGTVWDRISGQGDLTKAQEGDIAVFNRSGQGHVGFVKSVSGDNITIVGGNQSDSQSGGQVSVATRTINAPGNELLSIRRPNGENVPTSTDGGANRIGAPGATSSMQGSSPTQATMNPLEQTAMMGLMGGGMGMMGGMGGMMNMAGVLGGLASSIPMPQPAAGSEADMLRSTAQSDMNASLINQAAVQKQAQEEMGRETPPVKPTASEAAVNSNEMGGGKGYDYNHPADREWPNWASMLGGAHYKELGEGTAFNLFGK